MAELLYRLREWLTIPDAAAHLSIAFGEEVTEAEVLQLGLDNRVGLSVKFLNPVQGLPGKAAKSVDPAGDILSQEPWRISPNGVMVYDSADEWKDWWRDAEKRAGVTDASVTSASADPKQVGRVTVTLEGSGTCRWSAMSG